MTAVTHLLNAKFILKLAGICGYVMLIYVLNIKVIVSDIKPLN